MDLGRWLFRLRNYISLLPIVFAFFSTRGAWTNDVAAWSIAIVVAAMGVMLRAWAVCHCNYGQDKPGELTRTGPYAYVRNPLYVGNILIAAAATFASKLIWLVPVTVVWAFLTYAAVVKYEERRLLEKFGEPYRQYCAQVPAWIPARAASRPRGEKCSYVQALAEQSVRLTWLVPFALKQFHVFGLGSP